MKRDGVGCSDGDVHGPAGSEQPGERRDRERDRDDAEAEIQDAAIGAVIVLIEEAEPRRQDEKRDGDHRAPDPPAVS